jgi:arylsulfatase A-like enzyme
MSMCRNIRLGLLGLIVAATAASAPASAQEQQKPNILMIMADDIGYWNISDYNCAMMGYHTPNIDRIANEGAIFTDYYGQQSCTAGRAAFITGQSPLRTGLLKVGLPGAKEGLSEKDPTLAELLKPAGYATAQFGKNYLGDRNEFLPTVHRFDKFFGNLYHLNAEDEPENPDYPKNSEFRQRFGPRGVLKCTATSTETPGEDPRFGKWGKQRCLSFASAYAGPCSNDIAQFENAVRQSANNPNAGPSLAQSIDAQVDRQPTPGAVKRAEGQVQRTFERTLARAKRLDARGDLAGCRRALADAKDMYILY